MNKYLGIFLPIIVACSTVNKITYNTGMSKNPPMEGFSKEEVNSYETNKNKLNKNQWWTWSSMKDSKSRKEYLDKILVEKNAAEKNKTDMGKFIGCDGVHRFILIGTSKNPSLVFKNKEIQVSFMIEKAGLSGFIPAFLGATGNAGATKSEFLYFEIINLKKSPIKLVWNESTYVDFEGNSSGIFGKDTKFISADQNIPSAIIAPAAKLKDAIVPKSKLVAGSNAQNTGNGWSIQPLGLFYDENLYKKFSIGFTLEGTKEKFYQFEIGSCPVNTN